ncbi:MAG: hypothetical protein PHI63_04445 [Patescibacteria group bacterium]|nr:hypothetical protein [Patescibacteria group bacterium]
MLGATKCKHLIIINYHTDTQQLYIIITIGAFAVIATLMLMTKKIKPESKLSPLAGLAFALVIAGIVFGENRLVGYSFMGAGVLLAVIDIIKKLKK